MLDEMLSGRIIVIETASIAREPALEYLNNRLAPRGRQLSEQEGAKVNNVHIFYFEWMKKKKNALVFFSCFFFFFPF